MKTGIENFALIYPTDPDVIADGGKSTAFLAHEHTIARKTGPNPTDLEFSAADEQSKLVKALFGEKGVTDIVIVPTNQIKGLDLVQDPENREIDKNTVKFWVGGVHDETDGESFDGHDGIEPQMGRTWLIHPLSK